MSGFIKPEQIIVDDFILHPIPATAEYANMIYDIFTSDIDNFRYWFNGGMWKSVEEVLQYYQNKNDAAQRKSAMYGIFKNGDLLGEIGLSSIDTQNQIAEIGYWLKKSARGIGLIEKLIPVIE
ncbi:MAG: GNAT family N-acetyltransferase, partial [Alphaproteobacteria bacterium]